jgi:hypothetical protein
MCPDEAEAVWEAKTACALCEKTEDLVIDHCHDTNRVRGVLCRGCNRSIGQLGDTHEAIQRAADYLKETE